MKINVRKAVEKFNNWPATARIYVDRKSGRVWCDTHVRHTESNVMNYGEPVVEVHTKLWDGTKDATEQVIESELKQKCINQIKKYKKLKGDNILDV